MDRWRQRIEGMSEGERQSQREKHAAHVGEQRLRERNRTVREVTIHDAKKEWNTSDGQGTFWYGRVQHRNAMLGQWSYDAANVMHLHFGENAQ